MSAEQVGTLQDLIASPERAAAAGSRQSRQLVPARHGAARDRRLRRGRAGVPAGDGAVPQSPNITPIWRDAAGAGQRCGRAAERAVPARALELQPATASRFYLATLKDSSGDQQAAVDELLQLLRDAPPGAPWEPQVRQAVTAIAAENRIDIADRLPPPQPAPAAATAAIPGPTREQIEAARGIPPSQQDAMVQGMVDRLATPPAPESARRRRLDPADALADGAQRARRRLRGAALGPRRLSGTCRHPAAPAHRGGELGVPAA